MRDRCCWPDDFFVDELPMNKSHPLTAELLQTALSIALGIAIAVVLSPKDPSFFKNVLFYWGPHACVLVSFGLCHPPRLALAGVASALAAYLAAFGAWLFSRQHPESMAWVGYVFSFPGALIGAFLTKAWIARRQVTRPSLIAFITASGVLFGLAINQGIVCTTVMYCGGG